MTHHPPAKRPITGRMMIIGFIAGVITVIVIARYFF